jgi:hypothetical protein
MSVPTHAREDFAPRVRRDAADLFVAFRPYFIRPNRP